MSNFGEYIHDMVKIAERAQAAASFTTKVVPRLRLWMPDSTEWVDMILPGDSAKLDKHDRSGGLYSGETLTVSFLSPDLPSWERTVGSIRLAMMPGCCGVVVFTEANVYPKGRGLGTLLIEAAQLTARQFLGYSIAIGTDISTHERTRRLLASAGWSVSKAVEKNTRTGNHIDLFYTSLTQD